MDMNSPEQSTSQLWTTIEAWLQENAPVDYAALHPLVANVENHAPEIVNELEPQFASFLRVQNGSDHVPPAPEGDGSPDDLRVSTGVIPGFRLLSAVEVPSIEVLSPQEARAMNWVPFAVNDGPGYLVVDHNLGESFGAVLHVDVWACLDGDLCWMNIDSLLNDLGRALFEGELFHLGMRRFSRELDGQGQLLWRWEPDRRV